MCACLVSLIPSPLTGSGNETRLHWRAITQWKGRYVCCVLATFVSQVMNSQGLGTRVLSDTSTITDLS